MLEIIMRGSVGYLSQFFLLRLVLRREAGELGTTDLLDIVLIADAVQNATAGDHHSIIDGLLLGSTIIAWSFALDWLGYHRKPFRRFMHPPPLPLLKDGQLLRANLRKKLLTEDDDIMAELRHQGLEDLSPAKAAFLDFDGRMSIAPREPETHTKPERQLA